MDHEKAAMEAAIAEAYARMDRATMSVHSLIEHGWIAGRAYEPPAVPADFDDGFRAGYRDGVEAVQALLEGNP